MQLSTIEDRLALDVLNYARDSLVLALRFMAGALHKLELTPGGSVEFGTDAEHLAFTASRVFTAFRMEPQSVARDLLHSTLHCVFSHPFVGASINPAIWDLACDVAVENAISQLRIPALNCTREKRQSRALQKLQESGVRPLTAEHIYRHYVDFAYDDDTVASLRRDFIADDHAMWYAFPGERDDSDEDDGNGGDGERDSRSDSGESPQADGDSSQHSQPDEEARATREELEENWKQSAERILTDLDTASKQWNDVAGSLMQNLQAVVRERYDYAEFLRRFAVLGEEMRINDDEFDYVFYTYGLRLYENLPLVEPLEYRELKRIREFVIAIDTSASVSGELVQAFAQKTFNVLKQTESFFTRIHLRIIQCDTVIQDDAVITSQEEFDAWIRTMVLKGFGGTDFRPVFRYVDELIARRELTDLRGLIYFTDGYGTFPESQPAYESAFVFIDRESENPAVPVWAIKLILGREEFPTTPEVTR
ncbi:MAG: VWA-like domain-containing protein [Oscillospiraceae bacterium]|jgi:predicted metal-dependent peptidase|nr:VWA-like domain-containing protein [Oscillospiraceae bacterium]